MQKLEIKLNGSKDEILEEVKKIKEFLTSLDDILENEMKRTGEMWKNTGKDSYWKSFTNYSLAGLKINACKTYLLSIEISVRNNIAHDVQKKSIDYFKKSYAELVDLYEQAENEE